MGQLLTITSDSQINDDEYVNKIFLEFKRLNMLLSRLGRILEEIIYENDVRNHKMIFREFSRTSLYQVFGQGAKIMQDIYDCNSPNYNFLNLIGRIEKLIGQCENEFLKSVNFFILEPVQQFRLLYLQKVMSIKTDLINTNEAIRELRNTNRRGQEKAILIHRKYNIIHQKLIPTIRDAQQILLKLQNNIQSIIMSHMICVQKMNANLTHLFKMIATANIGAHSGDISMTIPNNIKDYRGEIYKNTDDITTSSSQKDYNPPSHFSQDVGHNLYSNSYVTGDKF